ncbi:MAG TPA: colicin immunity domain-containing protein, partial [Nakamurella sp.]
MREQYAKLPGLRLPPGSGESAVLDQLFVEVDVFRPDERDQVPPYRTEQELRESVHRALARLGR